MGSGTRGSLLMLGFVGKREMVDGGGVGVLETRYCLGMAFVGFA